MGCQDAPMDRTDRRGLVTLSRRRDTRRLAAISVLGVIMLIAMVGVVVSLPSVPDDGIDLGFFVFLFTGLGLYWLNYFIKANAPAFLELSVFFGIELILYSIFIHATLRLIFIVC